MRVIRYILPAALVATTLIWCGTYFRNVGYVASSFVISAGEGGVALITDPKDVSWINRNYAKRAAAPQKQRPVLPLGSRVNGASFIPFWVLIAVFSLPWISMQILAMLKKGRGDPSHCASCGYDLQGNLSGTCPECGRPCIIGAGEIDDDQIGA